MLPEETVATRMARDVDPVQMKLKNAMSTVNALMSDHGLSLALNKIEIVVLTKKRMQTIPTMRAGEEVVETKPNVRSGTILSE